jgi:drug/metabolite transporter (DMT)-like permease
VSPRLDRRRRTLAALTWFPEGRLPSASAVVTRGKGICVLAVLLALAAAAGYGGSDFWAGVAARQSGVLQITLLAELASVILMALVVPWSGGGGPAAIPVAWGAGAGAGGLLGALALYEGFRHAAFSVAGPLSAVGSAGFSVLAGLLLHEHPGTLSAIGIGLALPAIVAVSASSGGPSHQPAGQGHHAAGVLWGLLAGAGFAVLFIGLNEAGSGNGLWPVGAAQVTALLLLGCIALVRGQLRVPASGARQLAVLAGVTGGAGTILFFLATHQGLLAVTAVITSLYPAVTILLARWVLSERLTPVRMAGLGLAAASVALIAAGGVG